MSQTKQVLYILPGTMCTDLMFAEQKNYLSQQNIEVINVQFTTETTIDAMVNTAIEAMNHSPGNILGFSMGGIVALALAKKAPQLVKRLALLSSNSHLDLPERKAPRASLIKQAQTDGVFKIMREFFLPNYLFNPHEAHNDLILKMADDLGFDCFKAQLEALSTRDDTLDVLRSLNCPVAIIAGKEDKLCTADHQVVMNDNCSTSDLFLLSNCGHFPSLERAAILSQLLENWIRR